MRAMWVEYIPKYKIFTFPNGHQEKMYMLDVLSRQLHITMATLRTWERAHILPTSGFRDERNNRLYTEEQINRIVDCAERCHMLSNAKGKKYLDYRAYFKKQIFKEFAALNKKYERWMNPNAKVEEVEEKRPEVRRERKGEFDIDQLRD